jgi:hypothetical protein
VLRTETGNLGGRGPGDQTPLGRGPRFGGEATPVPSPEDEQLNLMGRQRKLHGPWSWNHHFEKWKIWADV